MPIFNLTIDDTSPLIQYAPAGVWGDSSHTDPKWQSYSNGTFHPTNHSGATATLTFNGSAVYLYGAFRGNHDVYWVTLDGTTTVRNGNSNPELFQQLMFSATDLSEDQHQLVLQNKYTTTTPSWVDVDYILVTSGNGDPTTQSVDTILDDTDPSISYSNNWTETPNNLITDYYNNTYHLTNQPRASATVSFQGNAITVYGATSGNHGTFTVALDGGVSTAYSGDASAFRPQNMLYYAGGLSNGSHTLTIANLDTSGKFLDLDKVVISNWGATNNASGSTNSTGHDESHPTSSTSKTNVGAIVGGVIGGVAFLLLALLALLFFLRRRRRREAESTQHNPETGAATQNQPQRNNFSSSREPMMIEPFVASRSIPVPHTTGASTIPTTASSSNVTSQSPLDSSVYGRTTDSSTVIDLTSASILPSKQDSFSNTRPSTHAPSNSESTSVNISELRTRPSMSMYGGSTTDDLPPPNYAEATASSRGNSSAGR